MLSETRALVSAIVSNLWCYCFRSVVLLFQICGAIVSDPLCYCFRSVVALDEKSVDGLYVCGLCHYYLDHVNEAFLCFKAISALAPDHVKAKFIYKVSE